MLYTIRDESSIRNILFTRLESVPGVKIIEHRIKQIGDAIRVGVLLEIDDLRLLVQSIEEFPKQVDRRQILNFCDEVIEGVKQARLETCVVRVQPRAFVEEVRGTGIRGHWDPKRLH